MIMIPKNKTHSHLAYMFEEHNCVKTQRLVAMESLECVFVCSILNAW